ncbi:hypothetical protein E2C01_025073 [Portunus trituberculatus]|uniref:Uncharacterized protein n=1 Tax=Portunus trituberculatus TaxID=210409 RepID=A0A5B7EEJ4_PORTR|nr:hypothetical protein [Portunus trituberculatus]
MKTFSGTEGVNEYVSGVPAGEMWSSVVGGAGAEVPGARHKHAMCVDHPHVYLLGGRHGNLPLKDFWTYDLGCSEEVTSAILLLTIKALLPRQGEHLSITVDSTLKTMSSPHPSPPSLQSLRYQHNSLVESVTPYAITCKCL